MPPYGHRFHPHSTKENIYELDQRAMNLIRERLDFEKYARTGITAYLKTKLKNNSQIDNYINTQNSKISKSNLSRAWKKNRENTLDIMIQRSLFFLLNIITKTVGTRV